MPQPWWKCVLREQDTTACQQAILQQAFADADHNVFSNQRYLSDYMTQLQLYMAEHCTRTTFHCIMLESIA